MILNMLRAKTKQIKEIRELQKQSLQNNPDEYMTGLYNGLEMAVAILEDREPIFETYIKEPEQIENIEKQEVGRTCYNGIIVRKKS